MPRRSSTARRATKTVDGGKLATMDASYGDRVQTLVAPNAATTDTICRHWRMMKRPEQFRHARVLAESNDFLGPINYLKEAFFNDGFRFAGTEGDDPQRPTSKLGKWLQKTGYDFARVVDDVWQEWLIQDNVVAFWSKPEAGSNALPPITVMDCEICEYTNAFGIETLKIRLPKVTLTRAGELDLQTKGLDRRYIDAMKNGSVLTVNSAEGERFRVLTRAKMGKGFCSPRVGSILPVLSTLEVLGVGDWAGASQMKKVMRQIRKGHAITQGPDAGKATHFLKKTEQTHILNGLKRMDGAFDSATNFDIKIEFPFLDPRYFDEKKYAGTIARLARWAGPVASILEKQGVSPMAMDAFETEGRRQRELVGRFLDSIFNHVDFAGGVTPQPLVSRWNQRSFTTKKMLIELTRFSTGNGLMSPQTGREYMDLDDKLEGDRMESAAKKRQRFTPPFEAKQGMVAEKAGGRPSEAVHPAGTEKSD